MTGSEDQPVDLSTLLVHLDAYTWKLDGDVPVSPEDLRALSDAAEALAPTLAPPERVQLAGRLERMIRALGEGCTRMNDRLGTISHGRRAVKGYAAIGASATKQ
jgi:hypothetical protein